MIVPIQPYKLKCPKCGYSKNVKGTSDILDFMTTDTTCPKCGEEMDKEELSGISALFTKVLGG